MKSKLSNMKLKTPSLPSNYGISFLLIYFAFAGSVALLSNTKSRPLLKFCFNSRDQFVAAQCVLCDFYQFSATVLGCNGKTSALMSNITSTEAVCIISNCLQQVRQAQPQFTGRKRREADEVPKLSTAVDEDSLTNETDEPEILIEKEELAIAYPSVQDFMKRYILDDKAVRDLEEQVVDKIEVMIAEEDQDYEF